MKLLLSCEHGGHDVPARFAALFEGHERVLESHRGWDAGALWLARRLARAFAAPLYATRVTRLLVDTNRSLHHPRLFSRFSRVLGPEEREAVVARYYLAHRAPLEAELRGLTGAGEPVLHVAVHSFTPRWQGRTRPCDVGLLYDPARRSERRLCARWIECLQAEAPQLRLRRNYPYRGNADGLTTHLRRVLPRSAYLGVELELSQRLFAGPSSRRDALARHVEASLAALLDGTSSR